MKIKHTMFLFMISLMTLFLPVPVFASEETLNSSIQKAAQKALEDSKAVSLQYAVWDNGSITHTGHVGTFSKSENRALTPDNLYGIGSVSKMYTTAAVMKLAEEGRLDLDQSVVTYLPDFRMADRRYKDITVRMLLNHSSGLPGSSLGSAELFNDPTCTIAADQLLDRLSNQPLKDTPGAFSVYCNDGFTLAQLVVEKTSGKSFEDYLRQEILTPMGLNNTYVPSDFTKAGFDQNRIAKTYLGEKPKALPTETFSAIGTGGIYATASDLAAFGGQLYESGVLNQASLNEMSASEYAKGIWPADTEDQISYGLGWDAVKFYPFAYSNVQALVKGGDTLRYHAGLLVLPEYKLSVAVISSDGVSTYNEAAAARMALDILKSKGINLDETPRALSDTAPGTMPGVLTAMSGYYTSSTLPCTVEVNSDGTAKLTTAYGALSLTYHKDGTFRDEKNTTAVKFVKEKNGEIYLWQKIYTNLPGLIQFPTSSYAYMKTVENPVSSQVQAAWEARNGTLYLPLDKRYTSQKYAMGLPAAAVSTAGAPPGYMAFDKLVDADHAIGVARIPGGAGRDWQNITFHREGSIEYMEVMGGIFQNIQSIPALYSGDGRCTISDSGTSRGHASWFLVGDAAGKTMNVTLPSNGGFYVYDENGLIVASSQVWGDTSAVLPQGGYVVFAGDPGVQFDLKIQ